MSEFSLLNSRAIRISPIRVVVIAVLLKILFLGEPYSRLGQIFAGTKILSTTCLHILHRFTHLQQAHTYLFPMFVVCGVLIDQRVAFRKLCWGSFLLYYRMVTKSPKLKILLKLISIQELSRTNLIEMIIPCSS